MTETFVVDLNDEELDKELERLRALPIQRQVKKDVKRKKRKKTDNEIKLDINKILGVSEEDLLKAKLDNILLGGGLR